MFSRLFSDLAAAAVLVLGLSGCTGLFFQPQRELVFDPATIGLAYEDIDFAAADGTRLHGWFFEAKGERLGSVLFLHGNAENISTHFASVAWLPEAGFDAFVFDYRGYGRSEGVPTLEGLHQDATAALDWLIAMPGIEPEHVAVFGQSLGGAVALNTIAASPHKEKLGALIIEGAFSDYRGLTREKLANFWLTWPFQWPLSLTVDNRYSPKAAAAELTPLPLLVIQGQKDEIIPPHHAEVLHDAAKQPKTIWRPPNARHIQALATVAMRKRLRDYLISVTAADSAGSP